VISDNSASNQQSNNTPLSNYETARQNGCAIWEAIEFLEKNNYQIKDQAGYESLSYEASNLLITALLNQEKKSIRSNDFCYNRKCDVISQTAELGFEKDVFVYKTYDKIGKDMYVL